MAHPSPVIIGIDLGTCYSCVGVFRDGRVEIIPNEEGDRITPSYVAFTDTARLMGTDAKNHASGIYDSKRLMGRNFQDIEVQTNRKYWPFRVIPDPNGTSSKPKFEVNYKGEEKTFYPEEISAMILTKLKEYAETYLGGKVGGAVIAVPAGFNQVQRQGVKVAGKIAGLNVIRIINAPSAAALAYMWDKYKDEEDKEEERRIRSLMVLDFGGGTCEVSVLEVEDKIFEVKATTGDTGFGGQDFDTQMLKYFLDEFKEKYKRDLGTNRRALRRLRTACERAKRTLSTCIEAVIEVDSIMDGIDYHTSITRSKFVELNYGLFKGILRMVGKTNSDAQKTIMQKSEIDNMEILLVGGSSRIPKIQEMIKGRFPGKELIKSLNADEAVAYGAAVYASELRNELTDMMVLDVTSHKLGIETTDVGGMAPIIRRNTTVPTQQMQSFKKTRLQDGSNPVVWIKVYEVEESEIQEKKNLLGAVELTDNLQGNEGDPEVTVSLDIEGFVEACVAFKTDNGKRVKVTVPLISQSGFNNSDIERMIRRAEELKISDQKEKDRVAAKNHLESFCFEMKNKMEEAINKCKDTISWVDSNELADKEEFEAKRKELEDICTQMFENQGSSYREDSPLMREGPEQMDID